MLSRRRCLRADSASREAAIIGTSATSLLFHAQVIEHWRQTATEAIIVDLEQYTSREEPLEALLCRIGRGGALEVRMRTWADNNTEAARAPMGIDRRRREYIERMLGRGRYPAAAGGNACATAVLHLPCCRTEQEQAQRRAARSDRHRARADRAGTATIVRRYRSQASVLGLKASERIENRTAPDIGASCRRLR
jgi:hypothetical protein